MFAMRLNRLILHDSAHIHKKRPQTAAFFIVHKEHLADLGFLRSRFTLVIHPADLDAVTLGAAFKLE